MKQSIKDVDIKNKNLVIRVDYNVPIKDGVITDNTRIVRSLETIKYALSNNCRIVLLSHLGRVKTEEDKKNNSLQIVRDELSKLLNMEVKFTNDFKGANDIVNNMKNGEIILLENTRWFDYPDKKESNCDIYLSSYFASFGDIFINDAFGTIHRRHASNYGISKILPSYVGFLVEEELFNLSNLENPERDYTVILGGAKVQDKIGLISKMVEKSDHLLIGGGMAFTFIKVYYYNNINNYVDEDTKNYIFDLMEKYSEKIVLPVDLRVRKDFQDKEYREIDVKDLEIDDIGLDIGSKTIQLFSSIVSKSKTILWNGPLGVMEFNNYREGTQKILEAVAETECYSIIGGGDTVSACNNLGFSDKISYISTGGGATLEYLEGKEMPGIVNIKEK